MKINLKYINEILNVPRWEIDVCYNTWVEGLGLNYPSHERIVVYDVVGLESAMERLNSNSGVDECRTEIADISIRFFESGDKSYLVSYGFA